MEELIRQIIAEELRKQLGPLLEALEKSRPDKPRRIITGNKALAEALGVSLDSVYRLIKSNKLKGARLEVGRRHYAYDLDKVLELIKE